MTSGTNYSMDTLVMDRLDPTIGLVTVQMVDEDFVFQGLLLSERGSPILKSAMDRMLDFYQVVKPRTSTHTCSECGWDRIR